MRLLSISLILFLTSCAALQKVVQNSTPTVRAGSFKMTSLDLESVTLKLDVLIDNPNPVSIPLSRFDYQININGNRLTTGQAANNISLPANQIKTIQIPFQVRYREIFKTVTDLMKADDISVELSGNVGMDIPVLGTRSVPINVSKTVPVPKIPRITVSSLERRKVSLLGATLLMKIKVDNPNSIGLNLNSLNYGLTLNGVSMVNSSISGKRSVAAGQADEIPVEFNVNFLSVGQALAGLLRGDSQMNLNLTGDFQFGLDHPLFKPVSRSLNVKDVLSFQ